jgi:hypothetical protein
MMIETTMFPNKRDTVSGTIMRITTTKTRTTMMETMIKTTIKITIMTIQTTTKIITKIITKITTRHMTHKRHKTPRVNLASNMKMKSKNYQNLPQF